MPPLVQNPEDLGAWRQRLFSLPDEMNILSPEEFETYWPYVSNVWSLNKHAKLFKGLQRDYYRSTDVGSGGHPPEKADEVMKWWVGKLETVTGGVHHMGVEQFKQEMGIVIE